MAQAGQRSSVWETEEGVAVVEKQNHMYRNIKKLHEEKEKEEMVAVKKQNYEYKDMTQ